jgi:hypothetical protein
VFRLVTEELNRGEKLFTTKIRVVSVRNSKLLSSSTLSMLIIILNLHEPSS